MVRRLMFVQLKTGYDADHGPSWVCWVEFTRSWATARFHGRELRRTNGVRGNFADVATGEEFWVSGPKRDRTDTRYGPRTTAVDEDAREAYEAFLAGHPGVHPARRARAAGAPVCGDAGDKVGRRRVPAAGSARLAGAGRQDVRNPPDG